jgi:peptidoglycan/LPS O-acetylase OafA/YrhL
VSAYSPTRLRQLDSLRGYSLVAVIAAHFCWEWRFNHDHLAQLLLRYFFALSGFLITGILLRTRDQVERGDVGVGRALSTFYLRRSLRIFPVYYLALAVVLFANLGDQRVNGWWHGLYLTNVLMGVTGEEPGPLVHLWSLAVEEQFYVVWPLLMLLLPRGWLPGFLWGMVGLGIASRFLLLVTANLQYFALPVACIDFLSFGAVLALHHHRGAPRVGAPRWAWPMLIAGAITLVWRLMRYQAPSTAELAVWYVLGDAVLAAGWVWVIHRATEERQDVLGRVLAWRPAVWLGSISYGTYVWHLLVGELVSRWWPLWRDTRLWDEGVLVRFFVLVPLCIVAGALSHRLIERPFERWRRGVELGGGRGTAPMATEARA